MSAACARRLAMMVTAAPPIRKRRRENVLALADGSAIAFPSFALAHELPDVTHRGATIGQETVVEFLDAEVLAEPRPLLVAQCPDLGVAVEIAHELHLRERGPAPFLLGLGLTLESFADEEADHLLAARVAGLNL